MAMKPVFSEVNKTSILYMIEECVEAIIESSTTKIIFDLKYFATKSLLFFFLCIENSFQKEQCQLINIKFVKRINLPKRIKMFIKNVVKY